MMFKGIDFMRPFPSFTITKKILLIMDYVSKWIKAITTPTNDKKVVLTFSSKEYFY